MADVAELTQTHCAQDAGNDAENDATLLSTDIDDNCDQDNDTSGLGDSTNYDSCDGAIPVHRCDRCETYETLSQAALLSHMTQCQGQADGESNTRDDRKMFECDVCNMKFSNGANMRRHKMRHTGVKPYECRVCQKRFFRKDHLAEHFTTHTKTLPYHCPICNRGFQRQIAMRAHFQNEHVGQHDMIKSCPLCSYRAGSMKSLRVHFFNRHGIDLDNPGPNSGLARSMLEGEKEDRGGGGCSDSGDSTGGGGGTRSADNATPPMHFLTPHVEISMADAPSGSQPYSPNSQIRDQTPVVNCLSASVEGLQRMNGTSNISSPLEANGPDCPGSPGSMDSNSNTACSMRQEAEVSAIMPSVSLIPIKQEPDDEKRSNGPVNLSVNQRNGQRDAGPANTLTSLIKVSPLKSLLREDLKRRGARGRPEGGSDTVPVPPACKPPRLPPSLHCVFCGIGFPDQTLYFLHKGCHSEANPWKCNICGEQCCNVYDFNSHLLSKTHQ
ncbi:zinc finger protein ztf-16 isoform X1 [Nilaparvata lugens]|uniref:zinc finger protein ztf-16 isoform X1 n=1 Tax=Nilaparvata lugens TaxID=108931 RepID=UPI00193D8A2F|nr:zinc finger protein ztf-16 isoform X1 [Nilaparvata lugens]XP_039280592.1 zinc finger protein ztf-16 isoform X2 [Nilaparvata lugens]XP_039280593.1 zinc finger protein ztf-16 isoform X1 [Nilaparvata lugens]